MGAGQAVGRPPARRRRADAWGSFYAAPIVMIATSPDAVELPVAARYGRHRDKLYFPACAKHLAWAAVDQPPLVPAVAGLDGILFGSWALALRVIPASARADRGCADRADGRRK